MNRINKIAALLDQFLVSGSNFILTVLLARLLNSEDFGSFSIAWLIVISVFSFIQGALLAPMLSFMPRMQSEEKKEFANILFSELIVILFLLCLLSLVAHEVFDVFDKRNVSQIIKGTAFIAIPYYLFDFLRKHLMVIGKNSLLLCIDSVVYIALIGGVYFFSEGKLLYTFNIVSGSFALGSLVLLFIEKYNWINPLSMVEEKRELLKEQVNFSKWLIASSGLQFLNGNMFTLILGMTISTTQVGYLRMAQNIVGVINPIYAFLDNHAQLYLARIRHEKGLQHYQNTYLKVALFCMTGLGIMLFVVYLFKDPIVRFIYGAQPREVNSYLVLMLILSAFTGANFLERLRVKITGNTKVIFKSYLFSALISCAMAYPLILFFQGFGAVQAMIIAQVIMLITMFLARYNSKYILQN
ncbi:MAG: lipopolysaccharide biosynthesis protein [Cocleimonas sp.]